MGCRAQGRVVALQALSGTGSLRVGAAFIAKFLPGTKVYLSNPTWGNHNNIFADAGVPAEKYRCWLHMRSQTDSGHRLDHMKASKSRHRAHPAACAGCARGSYCTKTRRLRRT